MKTLLMIFGAIALLAGVGGGAMLIMRRRRASEWDLQPDVPMPPGMSDHAPDQQVDTYYGGGRLGVQEPIAAGAQQD